VRFGSAEIYNVVRLFPEVEDSVCVGQRRDKDHDESVLLFLKLKAGAKRSRQLVEQLNGEIARQLSRRHVPKHTFYVDDIPYSFVGKKLEIAVKNIVSGRGKSESTVVANPESLQLYTKYYQIEKAAKREEGALAKL
jgi:acetoacetyl-CoA synthetase